MGIVDVDAYNKAIFTIGCLGHPQICRVARDLFGELWDHSPVRLLGVHASRVYRDDFTRHMCLFDDY